MGFERYFRQGRYRRSEEPDIDIVSLLQLDPPGQVTIAVPKVQVVPDPLLTVHVRSDLGVDLERRGIEVRKLFYAGFARKVLARGYQPDDVLQEVYKGILVRNGGACPFDPTKSSFAHYVCMIIECIWSNYKRRYGRLDRNEEFGSTDADGKEIDVAEADLQKVEATQDREVGEKKKARTLRRLALQSAAKEGRDQRIVLGCLDSLAVGLRPREIALELECDQREVAHTIAFLRKVGLRAGLSDGPRRK
jgi:DNA-directed RNA polymerase specialized sigma24 family protein